MNNLRSHPHLTLAQHLGQIREAARAIWARHSKTLCRQSSEALRWFQDAVTWHDAGKGSAAFQQYIADPPKYRGTRDSKVHTPLSTLCALRHGEAAGWEWRRALAVALIAAGHHSAFKTHRELDDAFCSMEDVIDVQVRTLDWDALGQAIGVNVRRHGSMDGAALCAAASDFLGELVENLHALGTGEAVAYRLQCQLAFSGLLEADKAFLAISPKDLPKYLRARQANLPAGRVDEFVAEKPQTIINPLRTEARRAMFSGLQSAGGRRVQTMTLPTGTGKTLLAASWALSLRERIVRQEGQPPLVLIVLPFLAVIDQTAREYEELFREYVEPGDLISFHSLSDRTYDPDLEDTSQDFFLDSWQSDVVITTFDQFLFALLAPKSRHQMRFHHLTDALIVLDEVQALPCVLWDLVQHALEALTTMGTSHVLAMSATQPGFLSKPHELIDNTENFFRRMMRYRIVLRHRTTMKLGDFVAECKNRLREWAGKRTLITMNTRRSGRRLRDELEKDLPDGLALEFLSADVTPKDRLAAIQRIRQNKPCLVVSTQCIEAGVDIDLDLVIRDFAPLDSIIQVAGRCNRHGSARRGIVEIVSLVDDESGRSFAGMIYDKILLQITRQLLSDRETILEEEVFPLTREYFARLQTEKDTGERETRCWVRWEEGTAVRRLLRGAQRPQWSFLVVGNEPGLQDELITALGIADRFDRRRAMRRLARRIAENSVSVYQTDELDPADFGYPFPDKVEHGQEWFWLVRGQHYTSRRGLDLKGKEGDQETWGVIL
jgi:CRISPR-associated endonuclease/helicase Cas3